MKHVLSQLPTYSFGCLDDVIVVFTLLNLLMMFEPCLCENYWLSTTYAKQMFVGIIASKPSQDFTRPLGMPRGLKMQSFLPQQRTYVSCFDVIFHFILLRD